MAHSQSLPQQPVSHPQTPAQLQNANKRPVLPGGGISSQQAPAANVPIAKPNAASSGPSNIKSAPGPSKEAVGSAVVIKTEAQRTKRPMNAFLIFSSERRPELQKADARMTTAELSKKLGDEWKQMDPPRKNSYIDKAKHLKEEFTNNHPGYKYSRRTNSTHRNKRGGKSAGPSVPIAPPVSTAKPVSYTHPPTSKGRGGGSVGKSKVIVVKSRDIRRCGWQYFYAV
jgi:hypothetical protein